MVFILIIQIIILSAIIMQPWYMPWLTQKEKNHADISQNREKEYESEKGRNLATKEDIEAITKKIEQVKLEISFKNHWEQDHIRQREERLLQILHLSNKIMMAHNRIVIKSRSTYNIDALFDLIDEVDGYAVDLTDNSNMLLIDYKQFNDLRPATHLVDSAVRYASELSCLANNVAISLQAYDYFNKRVLEGNTVTIEHDISEANSLLLKAKKYVSAPLQFKQSTQDGITEYIEWLETLYGEGSMAKYTIMELATDVKQKD